MSRTDIENQLLEPVRVAVNDVDQLDAALITARERLIDSVFTAWQQGATYASLARVAGVHRTTIYTWIADRSRSAVL